MTDLPWTAPDCDHIVVKRSEKYPGTALLHVGAVTQNITPEAAAGLLRAVHAATGQPEPIVLERVTDAPLVSATRTPVGYVGLSERRDLVKVEDTGQVIDPTEARQIAAVLATYADLAEAEQTAAPEPDPVEALARAMYAARAGTVGAPTDPLDIPDCYRVQAQAALTHLEGARWRSPSAPADARSGPEIDRQSEVAADAAYAPIERRQVAERIEKAITEARKAEDFATLDPPNIWVIAKGLAAILKPDAIREDTRG